LILKRTQQCKRLLYNYNRDFKCKCGCTAEPYEVSDFGRVCPNCKKKYSVTNGTAFHKVKFGLLKAFRIVLKDYDESFESSSSKIAIEFKITQKTAWNFLNKIRKDKDYIINLIEFKKGSKELTKRPNKKNIALLQKYLNNRKN
jgi:hypothetical protein